MLDNNNRQIILQYKSSNKDVTINNIKIVANNSKQEYVLVELKIINFNNIVNISINCTSILINCIL